jgi:hypothetical protein
VTVQAYVQLGNLCACVRGFVFKCRKAASAVPRCGFIPGQREESRRATSRLSRTWRRLGIWRWTSVK